MAEDSGWYNGYSWAEREAKLREMNRRIARGEHPPATGPCQLCGDPDVPVEYHDEDYSLPYIWGPPALLPLCRHCHRDKLHKRFLRPQAWNAFLAHVRRGGYARDLKIPEVKREVLALQAAVARGEALQLKPIRPYSQRIGEEWFASLSTDRESLLSASSRPRP
jgi:hypothetical protein